MAHRDLMYLAINQRSKKLYVRGVDRGIWLVAIYLEG
ncbi:hypothetical protein ES708_16460 [subsurface metagenome]